MIIAWNGGCFIDWSVFVFSLFAVILIMGITYYAGEYYDYKGDSLNREFNKFSGGTRVLPAGAVPMRYPLMASYICFGLAAIIGLILQFYYEMGIYTIPLGAFALLCGFFYSSKPFQWAYSGIGEILIFICYGWLTVNAAYYLQVSHFSLIPSLVSIPIGFFIFLVILINEFPDYAADKAVGKRTLVVRFGKERMARLYCWLPVMCYIAIICGYFYGIPRLLLFLSPLVLALIIWNILTLKNRSYEGGAALEKQCDKTILLDLLIASIYILAFTLG